MFPYLQVQAVIRVYHTAVSSFGLLPISMHKFGFVYTYGHVVSTTPTVNSIQLDLEFTFNTFDINAMGRFSCIIGKKIKAF